MASLQRLGQGVRRRALILRHRGGRVYCPVCRHSFDRFKDDWNRPDALCWRCGSHERHRTQFLLFEQRPELLAGSRRLLHFAPEWCIERRLRGELGPGRYVTADLYLPGVDLKLDITDISLGSASFDAVLCSHVLEHVEDDVAAMAELRRITAPGGWCLVMVPIDLERSRTYEDPAVTSPAAREREFWQHDHVRLYAPDIQGRLESAGFAVERIAPLEQFGPELLRRCRLLEADFVWLCRPA